MTPLAGLEIRPFEFRDYARLVEIGAELAPDAPPSLELIQYRDRTWQHGHRALRLVATRADRVVAWGEVTYMYWRAAYHPRRYELSLQVEPSERGRGIGSALHDRLVEQLTAWAAELVRVQIPATRSDAWSFLTHKGFVELIRRWELRLTVADVDLQRFRDVATHIAAQGIAITTFDVERARYGDQLVHELYDLEVASTAGEPRPDQDPETSVSFDRFVSQELHDPRALIDGHFLALDAQRIVGFTRLTRDLAQPRVLEQGFTGVTPEYRGRGIAAALKLHTVRYAQEHGYREIRTANDATNAPMLHINEVLGFRKHTAMIILERRLPARPTGRQSRPGSPTPPTNRSPQG